ncbi:uncharacterized protein TNCV_884531 [Trichonephila clavipes]|nr:uncharacterized protein TNCV_884531 [Trichonephila clavipes]
MSHCSVTRGLLATDYVILNHGQVTWTTPELALTLLISTPHQREDVSALDTFNVHRYPTRRVFSGTGLELVTRPATIRYLDHSATAVTLIHAKFVKAQSPHVGEIFITETWLGNESDISIPNFNCIVKNKRPNTRAGGVAIYQNSCDAVNIITASMECSVSQSDIYGTIQSSVGDLCLAECLIDNGQKL